jgi:hypothetical protein
VGSKISVARLSRMIRTAFVAFALTLAVTWPAAGRDSQLVPEGWKSVQSQRSEDTRRYVSPDGRALLTLAEANAGPHEVAAEKQIIARQPGETITYQKKDRSWIVVSGYRRGEIFYRRANLACAGTRWHLIELKYPRDDKRHMDAIVTAISHRLSEFHDVCPSPVNLE